MDAKRYLPVLAVALIVIAVQLAASLGHADYYLTQLTMSAYYTLVVLGLCMLMGYTGQISLGHAGFFAIGGYTVAVLTTRNLMPWKSFPLIQALLKAGILTLRKDLYGTDLLTVLPWASCIAAVLITLAVAFLIGIPVLRLKGHYLAMATLGFGLIIYRIILGTKLLGTADGISDIPGFPLFASLQISGKRQFRVVNYYCAWLLVIAGLLLLVNLVRSRTGRALRSIHEDEEAANALGIHTGRYKLLIFVLSAVFASVGGIFLTHFSGGIGPSEARIIKSVRYVALVAVGGMANLWGCLFMGTLLSFLSLRGYFGFYDDAVFGGILVAIMLFAPEGVFRLSGVSAAIKRAMGRR